MNFILFLDVDSFTGDAPMTCLFIIKATYYVGFNTDYIQLRWNLIYPKPAYPTGSLHPRVTKQYDKPWKLEWYGPLSKF